MALSESPIGANKAMSNLGELVREKISSIAMSFSGTLEQRVAVLGAFDTWPYMDVVSRLLAEYNYVAVTSRWIYRKFGNRILRFDIQEHPDFASNSDFLTTLLDQIISVCKYAVVNFSVSAAHFIETDWCFKKGKKTFGVAYVRSAFDPFENCCKCLNIERTPLGEYSECKASSQRTAWQCIRESAFCPFIRQGISKNVIEYFFRSDQMKLVAVENLRILPYVIKKGIPPLPTSTKDKISTLETAIIRKHESIFRKHPIFVILLVNHLLQGDKFDRASKLKLLALADTMPEVDINKLKQSEPLKSTEYMKNIEKGYVDLQNIADACEQKWFGPCVRELLRTGFLEQRELEYRPGQQAQLIRLSKIGKKFADFLYRVL